MNRKPAVARNFTAFFKGYRDCGSVSMPVSPAPEPKFIVVIGTSAGGLNSIIELSAQFTAAMDVAVMVVLHVTKTSLSDVLLVRIQKNTVFTCKAAENGELIRSRHLYLAPGDRHLIVEQGKLLLGDGPPENRWRPSIDVLFRSAAAAYDGRCIGIILTGLLQDGTSGMLAIKRSGGTTIVQDPAQAEYPDMPKAVLAAMQPDYCLPLEEMGAVLLEKSTNGVPQPFPVPDDVKAEAVIAARMATGVAEVEKLGERSIVSCPDCGGGLWEMVGDGVVRYRCYTGHVYTRNELLARHSESLENTLWVALRMLEERKNLLTKMSEEEARKGWQLGAAMKTKRAEELEVHVDKLKEVLFASKRENEADVSPAA